MCAQTRNELRNIETMSQEVLARIERGKAPVRLRAAGPGSIGAGPSPSAAFPAVRVSDSAPSLTLAEQTFWNYQDVSAQAVDAPKQPPHNAAPPPLVAFNAPQSRQVYSSRRQLRQAASCQAQSHQAIAGSTQSPETRSGAPFVWPTLTAEQDEDAYFDFSAPAGPQPVVRRFFPSRLAMGALMLVVAIISVLTGVVQGYIFAPEGVSARPVHAENAPSAGKTNSASSAQARLSSTEEATSASTSQNNEETGESNRGSGNVHADAPRPEPNESKGAGQGKAFLTVDVKGNVKQPGLVHVSADARVQDVIDAAGGPAGELGQINLARHVQDAEMIVVPQAGQVENTFTDAVGSGGGSAGAQLVSLNQASASELEKLPGVGPALAQRIVDYRQQKGGFKSVEELQKVSGIGQRKAQSLKGYVRL